VHVTTNKLLWASAAQGRAGGAARASPPQYVRNAYASQNSSKHLERRAML